MVRVDGGISGSERESIGLMSDQRPVLWSTAEVCEYLGISIETLYHWRSRNYGPPARRVGRSLRYVAADVVTWFEALDDGER